MTWWAIEIACEEAVDPEAVAAWLAEHTGQTVLEAPGSVVGYASRESAARRAADLVEDRFGPGVKVRVAAADPSDWTTEWKRGLAVRTVGRLRLGPSWLLAAGPDAVVIDPETAFGSGEHGSTRGALRLLDRHLQPGGRVLDLGAGSGVLAIAAAKLGAAWALGIEVDAEAVPVAQANAEKNAVASRARFVAGDAALLAPLAGPADLVVSNILRSVNLTLLDPIRRSLAPGGIAILAGMEEAEAGLVRPALAPGFEPIDEVIDEGWWAVAAVTR
jgi:ribosomal protein L11 methyltransferase